MLPVLKNRLTANDGVGDPLKISNAFPETQSEVLEQDNAATTTFVNDAGVRKATIQNPTTLSSFLVNSSIGHTKQDILSFLAKPVLLQSGTLRTDDAVTSFAPIILPKAALSTALYSAKTQGFLGIKCDITLRITLNATRFQQGRYMLCATYIGGSTFTGTTISDKGTAWYYAHTNTKYARTQLPRVELDLNCDTEGTLTIPYVSALNYYPLAGVSDNVYNYGNVFVAQLFPYSELQAGSGSTTAKYAIYATFSNVQLIGAATPQSGRGMYSTRKKSVTEKEQESEGIGPISSVMTRISKASNFLKPVPFLSSYASMVGWAADITGNVASTFGWSKPINLEHGMRVTRNALLYAGNVDGPDQSAPVSMARTNAVTVLPGFSGTDTDEMDLNYMASIPALYDRFNWNGGNDIGVNLCSYSVRPLDNVKTRSIGTITVYTVRDYIPVQFVADHFSYWRGSMVYKFKLIKTEFHSGRIAVQFFPEEPKAGNTSASYALGDYVNREIIDVRECNEFTIVIPYTSSTPYRPVTGSGSRMGVLEMYVVDPVVAPSTVTSDIGIIVEVAAGPDMEFAIPKPFTANPVFGATPQSNSKMYEVDQCAAFESTIGNSIQKYQSTTNAEACVGEKITSFRALLKSVNYILPTSQVSSTQKIIIPFGISVFTANALIETNRPAYETGDLYTQLGGIFLLSRGGIRYKMTTSDVLTEAGALFYAATRFFNGTYSTAYIVNDVSTNPDSGNYLDIGLSGPKSFFNVFQERAVEMQIPQYNYLHSRSNVDHCLGRLGTYATDFSVKSLLTPIYVALARVSGDSFFNRTFRSGSDDTNFGTFVSIPPMRVTGTDPAVVS